MKEKILNKDEDQIRELAAQLFLEKNIKSIERLGGLTNHTYAVTFDTGKYVFRLPGEGTEELIDRKAEKISTELASKIDVDTKLLYFNENTGVKVTRFIENAVTMSPASMRKTENIQKAARILYRLHTCEIDTGVSFEVFEMAEGYEKFIQDNGGSFYFDYTETRKTVMDIKRQLDLNKAKKVPCHNDPLCENWVHGVDRMYLIDWEYAGMNDPMWDLADLSIEADYTENMDRMLLETYLGRQVNEEDRLQFAANKVYLDFLWSLWGKTRAPFDGKELEDYAKRRYERMKINLKKLKV